MNPYTHGYWGEAQQSQSTEELIEEYAPILKTIADEYADETRQREVIQARLRNAQNMVRMLPSPLDLPWKNRVRVLKAKLRAAERSVTIQRERETSRRTFRSLGQVAIVGGILLTVALVVRVSRK